MSLGSGVPSVMLVARLEWTYMKWKILETAGLVPSLLQRKRKRVKKASTKKGKYVELYIYMYMYGGFPII